MEKDDRRSFLKLLVVATGTIALSGLPSCREVTQEKIDERIPADIFGDIKSNLDNAGLEQRGGKELKEKITEFLDNATEADKYLSEVLNNKELKRTYELFVQVFPNPDIKPEDNVFFIRDRAILTNALEELNGIDWTADTDELKNNVEKILNTAELMNSLSDEGVDNKLWPTTPENLALIYSKAGNDKPGPTTLFFGNGIVDNIRMEESEGIKNEVSAVFNELGHPPFTEVVVLSANELNPIPYWGKADMNSTKDGEVLYLGVVTKPGKWHYETIGNITAHEMAHLLDPRSIRPGLLRMLSPEQLIYLYNLRLKAMTGDSFYRLENLRDEKVLRGKNVWGDNIEGENYRNWFFENVECPTPVNYTCEGCATYSGDHSERGANPLKACVTQGEWEIVNNVYPTGRWDFSGILHLTDDTIKELVPYQSELTGGNNTEYSSFAEFVEGEKKILSKLNERNKTVGFVRDKILEDELVGQTTDEAPSAFGWSKFWYGYYRQVIADDLITEGKVKEYIDENVYKKWIVRAPQEFFSSSAEGFADKIAFYYNLQKAGNVPEFINNDPNITYFKEVSKLLYKANF
jgi:hypothetical protein